MTPSQQMHDIRSNPQLHSLIDARIGEMEKQAQSPNTGKMAGRYNVKGAMEANPLLRWPKENFPIGKGGQRPSFDDLAMSQFVSGMITSILDMNLPMYHTAVLRQLRAIMTTRPHHLDGE